MDDVIALRIATALERVARALEQTTYGATAEQVGGAAARLVRDWQQTPESAVAHRLIHETDAQYQRDRRDALRAAEAGGPLSDEAYARFVAHWGPGLETDPARP